MSEDEKLLIIKALQFYINNSDNISFEELRKMSDLKERIRVMLMNKIVE